MGSREDEGGGPVQACKQGPAKVVKGLRFVSCWASLANWILGPLTMGYPHCDL